MAKRPVRPTSDPMPSEASASTSPAPDLSAPPATASDPDTVADIAPDVQPAHLEAALQAQMTVAQATAPPQDSVPPRADAAPNSEMREDTEVETDQDSSDADGRGTADPSGPLNSQILSTATTTDLLALGLTKSASMALLGTMMSQNLSLAMQNAVARQQADRIVSQALINAACANLLARTGAPNHLASNVPAETSVSPKAFTEQAS